MTWARFHDLTPRDPKIAALTDAEHRLWFNAICYGCEQLTNGQIDRAVLALLYPATPRRLEAMAARFVTLDLWRVNDDGWEIVNFLKYNPTRERVEETRAIRQQAGSKGGSKAKAKQQAESNPVPVPVPSLLRKELAAAAAREKSPPDDIHRRAYNAWDRQSPGGLLPPIIDHLNDELEAGTPIEWIEAACESAGEENGYKGWNYIKTTLTRYKKAGTTADTRQKKSDAPGISATSHSCAGLAIKCMSCEAAAKRAEAASAAT